MKPYELGNVFFTGKANGTVYAIVLSSQDGESMPSSVVLPASLTVNARVITLVGGDGTALAFKSGRHQDTTEFSLPAAGAVQMPSTDAWCLKIVE